MISATNWLIHWIKMGMFFFFLLYPASAAAGSCFTFSSSYPAGAAAGSYITSVSAAFVNMPISQTCYIQFWPALVPITRVWTHNYCGMTSLGQSPGGGVRGCAAQIGCFFGLSGLPMAPFLFVNWFRYRLRFCKMHNFWWIFPLIYL